MCCYALLRVWGGCVCVLFRWVGEYVLFMDHLYNSIYMVATSKQLAFVDSFPEESFAQLQISPTVTQPESQPSCMLYSL